METVTNDRRENIKSHERRKNKRDLLRLGSCHRPVSEEMTFKVRPRA